MKVLELLEKLTGEMWTAVLFHSEDAPKDKKVATRQMRLCEAVSQSFTDTFVLPRELIHCPGACRSLDANWSHDDDLAHKISEKTGVPPAVARRIITDIPRLHEPIAAVTLGKIDKPDVVLSYLCPNVVMQLVRRWQAIYGTSMEISISSFMAVCGNIVVKAFELQQPCLSFGCPESREYGGIGTDKLILGMPHKLAKKLVQENYRYAHV